MSTTSPFYQPLTQRRSQLFLKLKAKEEEIIKNFMYHGIGNTDDELYIYLFELLNGRPPISVPDNFTDLMTLY